MFKPFKTHQLRMTQKNEVVSRILKPEPRALGILCAGGKCLNTEIRTKTFLDKCLGR